MDAPAKIFQNHYLRPIIKAKNEYIMGMFQQHPSSKTLIFDNPNEARNNIENLLKRDLQLRNLLIGAILSELNNETLIDYFSNKNELNRRIVSIISKRIYDNLYTQ
jgi:tRNA nucleotidyltransferase/poly(A) polymerase